MLVAALLLTLAGCGRDARQLDIVLERGTLRVGTVPVPGTYAGDSAGRFSFDVALSTELAASLGVKVSFHPYPSRSALLEAVASGEVDLAAASLTPTPGDRSLVRYSSVYRHEPVSAVYRRGNPRPRRPEALADLNVVAATDTAPLAAAPGNDASQRLRADDALTRVHENDADVAIVQRLHLESVRLVLPQLREAFDPGVQVPLALAFSRDADDSLYTPIERWLMQARGSGELGENGRLRASVEGHRPDFDYVAMLLWQRHQKERLPAFEGMFREAAAETGLDWRLLAAVAYQESHWQPDAVSPTGVRGLMMLTRATAAEMGVRRRTDPAESVMGGARYLRRLLARVNGTIPRRERLWYALAAYNIGQGHVLDAMALTRSFGGDPHRWADVRSHLPKLEQARYHQRTRFGYARGREPVRYVSSIRRYYEALRLDRPR